VNLGNDRLGVGNSERRLHSMSDVVASNVLNQAAEVFRQYNGVVASSLNKNEFIDDVHLFRSRDFDVNITQHGGDGVTFEIRGGHVFFAHSGHAEFWALGGISTFVPSELTNGVYVWVEVVRPSYPYFGAPYLYYASIVVGSADEHAVAEIRAEKEDRGVLSRGHMIAQLLPVAPYVVKFQKGSIVDVEYATPGQLAFTENESAPSNGLWQRLSPSDPALLVLDVYDFPQLDRPYNLNWPIHTLHHDSRASVYFNAVFPDPVSGNNRPYFDAGHDIDFSGVDIVSASDRYGMVAWVKK